MARQNKNKVLKLGVWNLKVLYVIFVNVNLEHSLKQLELTKVTKMLYI